MRCWLLLLLPALAACGAQVRYPARAPQQTLAHADARVGTYVSSEWGFTTSSYWIEGPSGLIVIDTQFLPSAAEEMLQWAEASTGKKVVMAIVLHPNPDKFNGTDVLRRRGIKVVTSEQVRKHIPHVHEIRTRSFYERYKPDYPTQLPMPDAFGDKTTELTAGGVTVKAHVMGAGCSEAHVVVEYEGHLFPGDLVANDAHSWLELGHTDAWLQRIEEMKKLNPKFVHPGRGPSGTSGLLDMEAAYLKRVMAIVGEEKPQGAPQKEALDRIRAKILEAYPGYEYEVFLDIGLPAEWERQAKK